MSDPVLLWINSYSSSREELTLGALDLAFIVMGTGEPGMLELSIARNEQLQGSGSWNNLLVLEVTNFGVPPASVISLPRVR